MNTWHLLVDKHDRTAQGSGTCRHWCLVVGRLMVEVSKMAGFAPITGVFSVG